MSTDPEDRMPAEEITDEMLMAYIDGDPELPPHMRRRIAAALPHSPELVARMESFLFTKGPMQRAFDETLAVPDWLMAAVAGEAKPAPRRRAGFDFRELRDLLGLERWGPRMAIAAIGALLVGSAGWLANDALRSGVDLGPAGLQATGSFHTALEQTPSGTTVPIGSGVQFRPTATFASAQDTWCRQFVLSYEGAVGAPGLACREAEGNWRVLIQEAAKPKGPARGVAGSGEPPTHPDGDTFEAYLQKLRKGNTLSAADESRLLGVERWSRKP